MTLRDLQSDYKAAVARAEEARALFLRELRRQRETRTLDDIGRELGLTRSRVAQLLKNAKSVDEDA